MHSSEDMYCLAVSHHRGGRLREAAEGYRAVMSANPGGCEAVQMLGLLTHQMGDLGSALEFLRRALKLAPDNASCYSNLGMVLASVGRFAEAEQSLRRALSIDPRRCDALNRLGDVLLHTGRLDDAVAIIRRSLSLRPDPALASKLLIVLHCHPESTPRSLLEEHLLWDQTYARPVCASSPWRGRTGAQKHSGPLKIGYVSPVLSQNPVGRFLLPVLAHHDRREFLAYCYTDTSGSDPLAAPLRQAAYAWRCTAGMDDAAVAEMIRADGIDVLVDLAAHAEGNRLQAFARRPAPVQVTWLSYCSTTGLREMDYRLSDPYLDPPGSDLTVYTEKTVRLPRTYWCYPSHGNLPEVSRLPSEISGQVTFGCLCNFIKLTPPTLRLWARILRSLPDSKLVLSAPQEAQRQVLSATFAAAGVDHSGRLEFLPALPLAEYFATYARIDIALDPFPYPGGTTTLDAIYMGVPTISLPGITAVSRAGVSLLNNVGLGELVARSPADYVAIAVSLARDVPRLKTIRSSLRQRLHASPLMDAPGFTRALEEALTGMWNESAAKLDA